MCRPDIRGHEAPNHHHPSSNLWLDALHSRKAIVARETSREDVSATDAVSRHCSCLLAGLPGCLLFLSPSGSIPWDNDPRLMMVLRRHCLGEATAKVTITRAVQFGVMSQHRTAQPSPPTTRNFDGTWDSSMWCAFTSTHNLWHSPPQARLASRGRTVSTTKMSTASSAATWRTQSQQRPGNKLRT